MSQPYHQTAEDFFTFAIRAREYTALDDDNPERKAFMPIERHTRCHLPPRTAIIPENIIPKYVAVFCILLRIHKGPCITEFTKYANLSDANLPFTPSAIPPNFPYSDTDSSFYSSFCTEQWQWCAPTFQRHMLNEVFPAERVLPIMFKQKLAGGGMSMTSNLLSDSRPIYTRLEDTDEIRLLILRPRSNKSNETVIECTIEHVKLSNRPQYEALSYMWGSEEDGKTILVDNTVCHVRKNLWLALLHLRLEKIIRYLWIDALCINQLDVNERNHQVTQMGRIYRNAKGVIAWLGASDAASDLAARVLNEELENRLKSGQDVTTAEDNKGLEAIKSLCFREYWERLWIVQEVLMALDIII